MQIFTCKISKSTSINDKIVRSVTNCSEFCSPSSIFNLFAMSAITYLLKTILVLKLILAAGFCTFFGVTFELVEVFCTFFGGFSLLLLPLLVLERFLPTSGTSSAEFSAG